MLKGDLHVKAVGGIDDVINEAGFLLVERLHGSAATTVFDPLHNQTHDVDTGSHTHTHAHIVRELKLSVKR